MTTQSLWGRRGSRNNRMLPIRASWLLFATMAITGCSDVLNESPSDRRSIPDNFVPGSFIVTTTTIGDDDAVKAQALTAGAEIGCDVEEALPVRWRADDGPISEELRRTYHIRYANCDLSREQTTALMDGLAADASIATIEAEAVATSGPVIENDPYKDRQRHLTFLSRDQACEQLPGSSEPIVVAVVDSGVDVDHPDLVDAFYRNSAGSIVGANFVGSGSQMPPNREFDDGTGHGTHVAGLIAATANNAEGGVGVASCGNVQIMPIRVLGDDGKGSTLEIERGVQWAVDNGADIINLSLGYTARYDNPRTNFRRSLFRELAGRDIVVFAAAGNDGYVNGDTDEDGKYQYHFPSSYDDVISVAATDNFGNLTSFSNRGERTDIAAPGYYLWSTYNGSYRQMSGTSMASPVAAGAYALALQTARAGLGFAESLPGNSALELLNQAKIDGSPLRRNEVQAGGVVDMAELVQLTAAAYPVEEPIDEEPVDEEPIDEDPFSDEPADDEPADDDTPIVNDPGPQEEFRFVGLDQRQFSATNFKLAGLPEGTRRIYLFWGSDLWSFSRIDVRAGSVNAETSNRWFLFGSGTVRAYAVDANGRPISVTSAEVNGI